ncbi:mlr2711 [Mesorhizobium japonicum MAFF 303099]|uniref:Mlr2711 protein n=1 Tax=Mesorhizobium japonicum (strain LMG 29417 / CECT 9101 / MAFF 303099) TaxID=266835 RepID=Q98HU1_RHILO|nr:mlr2711 [Mesorhizobium japonicum MAFF 303099]
MRQAPSLPGAEPDQHSPGDVVFADDAIVLAQAAQLALDEIAVHRLGGLLEKLGAQLLIGIAVQPGQRFLDLLAGTAERRRLFGQDFVAKRIEGRFSGRRAGKMRWRTQGHFSSPSRTPCGG